jgi:hypothetical protein
MYPVRFSTERSTVILRPYPALTVAILPEPASYVALPTVKL